MRERWRKVRRADGYKVSSLGQVRSLDRTLPNGAAMGGRMLTPFLVGGYLHVTINGEQVPVHLLVLEAFHGLRPYGMEGCHGPNGPLDNRTEVLRWDTHLANVRDGLEPLTESGAGGNKKEEKTEEGNRTSVSHQNWLVSSVAGDVAR